MDKLEKFILQHLENTLPAAKSGKTANCPDEQVLLDYLEQKLEAKASRFVENHLANCGFCLNQLALAFEAKNFNKQNSFPAPSQELINKTKALLKTDQRDRDIKVDKKRKLKKNLCLSGAVLSFILSFLVPRYFMQFLVVTLILGLRWSFESESGRTLIMVLDSWRKHSHDEDEKISQRLKDRSNSFRK